MRGDDITIDGEGSQARGFCYVDGMIEGFVRMMNSERGFTGPVNIGNPGEFTMLELAESVLRLNGSQSKLTSKPLSTDDPRQCQPDITLAKAELDWRLKAPLRWSERDHPYLRKLLDD